MSRGAGSNSEQAARLAADRERAAADPAFAKWRFGDRADARPDPADSRGDRRRVGRAAGVQARAAADAAYREALRVGEDAPLPSEIGQARSGGAARGGLGASRKGKGRNT